MNERPEPSEMSDKDLAEEYKSYYLQVQNDFPYGNDEVRYLRLLRKEVADRDSINVLESVRVLDSETEEVLAE